MRERTYTNIVPSSSSAAAAAAGSQACSSSAPGRILDSVASPSQ
jgi:hypothetical protein